MTTAATRDRALLLVLAGAAWALTAERMAGMDGGPGADLGEFGWFALSWLLMMAAMMLPAVAPVGASASFAAGYLGMWVAAGLAGYAAIEGVRSVELGFLAWDEAGRLVAAAAIVGAGIYQLTPAKAACLRRCRERHAFTEVRRSFRMGVRHGGDCIGCCWAMMVALFALGLMSLTWMAVVAALIAAERLLPWNVRLGVAVALVALGAAVGLAPSDVPGLTVPGGAMDMG